VSEGTAAIIGGEANDTWIRRARANVANAWEYATRAQGGRWDRWEDAHVSDLGSSCPFLNNITLIRPLDEMAAANLATRIDAFFGRQGGGSSLLWSGWPTPDLARHGFNFWGQPPLMVRAVGGDAPDQPAGLRIDEVSDATGLVDFEQILVNGYPTPWLQPFTPGCAFDARVLGGPLRFWVGYVDGQPVSCSAAFVDAEVVGVFMVATLAEARGKGYGSAITWAATSADPELPALLHSSDAGRPVYERLGYRIVTRFDLWECPRKAPS